MELGAGLMYAPFLKQAADHPGACAVIGRNRVLSYGELEEISRALALQLREKASAAVIAAPSCFLMAGSRLLPVSAFSAPAQPTCPSIRPSPKTASERFSLMPA